MRGYLRWFARNGGTVLLSSHPLAEIAHSADDAIIINHGRLVGAGAVASLAPGSSAIRVLSPDHAVLAEGLTRAGAEVQVESAEAMVVTGLSAEQIGGVARDTRAAITEMRALDDGLEAAFSALIERTDATS